MFVPECHSTNNLALQLCQQSLTPEGTLVITNNQTAGRGQRGNMWQTQAGLNLTFSLVLKPTFLMASEQHYLNLAVSLGLYDCLKNILKVSVHIKWPNDIIVEDKKVCGILIENSLQGSAISYSVIGIGLNVNQTSFTSDRAGSLKQFTETMLPLQQVLEPLLSAIEARYLSLRGGNKTLMKEDYNRAMLGFGNIRNFKTNNEEFHGTITGMDESGKLKISTAAGEKIFGLKEVEFIY